ncbi:MAG: hypothetical protein FWG50_04130 [Kiritimatiellaeota bacterium]|nr:hypothetical protein [Kiritimatiellota bacterium]
MKPKRRDPFIRACRALIETECARDPRLRRQLKKTWTLTKIAGAVVLTLFCCCVFVALPLLALSRLALQGHEPPSVCLYGAVIAALWCAMFIFIRSMLAPRFPAVLFHVPLAPADYRAEMRCHLLALPWAFCPSIFLLLCGIAFFGGASGWATVPLIFTLAILCALASVAAALWLKQSTVPTGWYFFITLAIFVATLISAAVEDTSPWLFEQVENHAEAIALLMPGGWAAGVLSAHAQTFSRAWWCALIPLLGLSASLPLALRRLERHYTFERFLATDWGCALRNADDDDDQDGELIDRDPPHRPAPAAGEPDADTVRRHWAPVCETSRTGWLERLFIRRLSPEEKITLEHISPRFPRWTLWMLRALGAWVIAVALFVCCRNINSGSIAYQVAGSAMLGASLILLAVTCPGITDLSRKSTCQWVHPFPLRQWFHIRQKAAYIRCAAVAPVYLAIGGVIAYLSHTPAPLLVPVNILLMTTLGLPHLVLPHLCLFTTEPIACQGWLRAGLQAFTLIALTILLFASSIVSLAWITHPLRSLLCALTFILLCRLWKRYSLFQNDRGYCN